MGIINDSAWLGPGFPWILEGNHATLYGSGVMVAAVLSQVDVQRIELRVRGDRVGLFVFPFFAEPEEWIRAGWENSEVVWSYVKGDDNGGGA